MLLNRRAEEKRRLTALTGILLALVIGMGLNLALPAEPLDRWEEDAAPWQTENREDLRKNPLLLLKSFQDRKQKAGENRWKTVS